MQKPTQKFFFKLLEEELITVLAVAIVGLGIMFAYADSATTTLSLTILPAGGTITVTAPDGGESWKVNSTQNITWTTQGDITDVKIELQRTTGGSWTEITASTTNDGSYPWPVTSPTTSTAKVRISKVGDASVFDISDDTFSITSAGGGGGIFLPQPGIDDVNPYIIASSTTTVLTIQGINFKPTITFQLDRIPLTNVIWIDSTQAKATVPAGLSSGNYRLWAYNNDGTYTYWGTLIQVIYETWEAGGVNIPEVIDLYLRPGERQLVELKFLNTSNVVWNTTLKIGTTDPQDRNSIFYDPTSWISLNRPAAYAGSSVGYGGEAEISFYMKAPDEPGEYTEKFALVLEEQKWLDMKPVTIRVLVLSETGKLPALPPTGGLPRYYSAKWLKQSSYLVLKPNQAVEMWVEFENTGTLPWYNSGANPVRLGTSRPLDRKSAFANGKWILYNRPTVVNGVTTALEDGYAVDPGEVGRFIFEVVAPNRPGSYREYFRPVVEWKEWLPDWGVYWDIKVTGSTTVAPSTGGEPVVQQPLIKRIGSGQPSEFRDVTENLVRSFVDTISKLFSGIANLFSGWF